MVAAAEERRRELARARDDATALDARAAAAAEESAAKEAALEAETSRAPARELAAQAARDLEALAAQTSGLAELRARRDAALADAARERRGADAAAATWRRAAETLDALERLWTVGRAGALSASLAPGLPCPVCGSTDHPAPAAAVEGAPGDEALDQARSEATALMLRKDELATAAARAETVAAGLEAELTARLAGLPEGFDDEGELAAALAAAVAERDTLGGALGAAQAGVRTAETELAVTKAAAAAAGEQARHCAERCDEAESRLSERLSTSGFADEPAWRSAARDAARIDALRSVVAAFDKDLTAARDRALRASAAAEGLAEPDVAAADETARAAHEELLEATRRDQKAQAAVAVLLQTLDALRVLDDEAAQLDERYGVVGAIADVANGRGRNTLNLRFQSFVLGAFLDRVLEVASQRLGVMTEGRYDLQRTESARRGRATGLDLEVADAWTGETRPVSTLSGGETFMAALSLALGLAEVVQEYSGGVRLDTVFIDEGFGSLDAVSYTHLTLPTNREV